jgi:hypothetical protein
LSIAIFTIFWFFYAFYNLKEKDWFETVKNAVILSFCSYPFLYNIDRANFEGFVFIFLALFVYFYIKKKDFWSILFLAAASAMKLFPIILALLFIADKKYKQAILSVILTVVLSVLSVLIYSRNVVGSFVSLLHNQSLYTARYAIGNDGLTYSHSLFGLIKKIVFHLKIDLSIPVLANYYMIATLIVMLFLAIYIVYIEKELWKKVALSVIAFCLLPQVSSDYKLIHFMIPIFLFINIKKSTSFDFLYAILFALLLIPKNYNLLTPMSDGVILNPIIMTVMMVLIIYEGFKLKSLKRNSPKHD